MGIQFGMGIADDAESYMDAPRLRGGGGDGSDGSFIANLFDMLGIHKQVGARAKPEKVKPAKVDPRTGLVEPEMLMALPPTNRPSSRFTQDLEFVPLDNSADNLLGSITNSLRTP